MNDSIEDSVRSLVERAVQPIRTTGAHRNRLREELLAHFNALFKEESALTPNESLAMIRAAQRFGNIEEMTAELQESAELAVD